MAGFGAHQGFFLAAGLSFFFMVCLIPLLFLIVSIAGFVLTSEAAAQAVLNQLSQIVPVYKKELSEALARIIESRKMSGIVGTVILVFFSTQLFAALRLILNQVFGVAQRKGLMSGLLWDVLMVFAMGGLFLASVVITDLFFWIEASVMVPARMPPRWIVSVFVALALGFNTALFFISYRYFPNRRVLVGPALAGALLASILWETAKQVFRLYIVSVGLYDQVYGPLGVLVALSMFTYYTALVFILGAEFAMVLESRRDGLV